MNEIEGVNLRDGVKLGDVVVVMEDGLRDGPRTRSQRPWADPARQGGLRR